MIIARFNCPNCETPIEAPDDSIADGIKCPQCETEFVPEQVSTADEAVQPDTANDLNAREAIMKKAKAIEEELRTAEKLRRFQKEREEHDEKWRDFEKLKHDAQGTFVFGILFLFVALIAGFCAFEDSEHFALCVTASGGAMSLSILFLLFSQLLQIRAGLEKLANKK